MPAEDLQENFQKIEKDLGGAFKEGGLEGVMKEIGDLMKQPGFLKSIAQLSDLSQEAFKTLQYEFNKDKVVKDAQGNLQAIEFSPPVKDTRHA